MGYHLFTPRFKEQNFSLLATIQQAIFFFNILFHDIFQRVTSVFKRFKLMPTHAHLKTLPTYYISFSQTSGKPKRPHYTVWK